MQAPAGHLGHFLTGSQGALGSRQCFENWETGHPGPVSGRCSGPCHPHRQVLIPSPDGVRSPGQALAQATLSSPQTTPALQLTYLPLCPTNPVIFPKQTITSLNLNPLCLAWKGLPTGPSPVFSPQIRPHALLFIPGHLQAFAYSPYPYNPLLSGPGPSGSSPWKSPPSLGPPL